jgi:glycosyltransferase involved in cell wall biosynthesis
VRILQIIQKKQLRGAEVFACQLSTHWISLGHTVRVISLQDGDANLPFPEAIQSLSARLDRRFSDWRGWKRLAQEIETFRPDVVQANAGDTLKYAILSKIFFGWKAPVVFRNASMMSAYIRSSVIRRFNEFLLHRATHIASVSEASRADLVKLFPSTQNKITVIPIGIEERSTTRITRQPGFNHLVHVGGFSFEKNHKGLLRIFANVLARRKQVRLWLVGDGPLREEMEAYARELQVDQAVYFLGYQSNALDYIASADVLLLPSIIEGLPGVIVEAFYTHTPVVANNVGGIAELVENDNTGWLVEKGDEHAFANAVLDALDRQEHAAKLGERAYARVRENYMNQGLATKFIQLYGHLLNPSQR